MWLSPLELNLDEGWRVPKGYTLRTLLKPTGGTTAVSVAPYKAFGYAVCRISPNTHAPRAAHLDLPEEGGKDRGGCDFVAEVAKAKAIGHIRPLEIYRVVLSSP